MRPRRSSGRASRSATRTSRSPLRYARGRSRLPTPRRVPRQAPAESARRWPRPGAASSTTSRAPSPGEGGGDLHLEVVDQLLALAHEPPLGHRPAVEPLLNRLAEREILLADLRAELDDVLDLLLGDVGAEPVVGDLRRRAQARRHPALDGDVGWADLDADRRVRPDE